MLSVYKNKVLQGGSLSRAEAMQLLTADLQELCTAADQIRAYFCKEQVDLCCIINGKSGSCSENCRYCAQSTHYSGTSLQHELLSKETILQDTLCRQREGIQRYSIVTSGRKLCKEEVEKLVQVYRQLSEQTTLSLCASCGLLDREDFLKLKAAGVTRYHNNLETSRSFFPSICTTHSYDDKMQTLHAAKQAGLKLCCGGILGLGERWEDRIDLALELRTLEVLSIPINFLNPIPGTPLQAQPVMREEEMLRAVAIFRFLHPRAFLRLAGGRSLMRDKGKRLLQSGANALISGDMLTTAGVNTASDLQMLKELGRQVVRV